MTEKHFMRVAFTVILISSLFAYPTIVLAARNLELTLSCDKDKYQKDEPIQITLTLKNRSGKPIYVNKRFFLTSGETPVEKRDGYITVISPKQEKLKCKIDYGTGLPRTDHFILLEPGKEQSSERKQTINHFFDFSTPGKYQITATYENVFGKEIGLDAFTGKIDSNTVTIEIVEKKE